MASATPCATKASPLAPLLKSLPGPAYLPYTAQYQEVDEEAHVSDSGLKAEAFHSVGGPLNIHRRINQGDLQAPLVLATTARALQKKETFLFFTRHKRLTLAYARAPKQT